MRNEERAAGRAQAENKLAEPEKKEFKFRSHFPGDGVKRAARRIGLRNAVLVFAILLIGAAVYINWTLFSGKNDVPGEPASSTDRAVEAASFFASATVNRQKARDEAMEVLQSIVDNTGSSEDAKAGALTEITAMALTIEKEANIESLVKSKGFDDCVAVISGDSASIVVKCDRELMINELSQILEIVYEQANIEPARVTISSK
ncbi:MAG: SpoIIIAH-like family protein [Clostridia bacterium]|nr:SpoIIIAH-like family protein [Clostridia bacterium]